LAVPLRRESSAQSQSSQYFPGQQENFSGAAVRRRERIWRHSHR